MGMVVSFVARRHGRASAGSRLAALREANSVKRSAVTPPALPVADSKIGDHHSAGMLSRWSHLRADATDAPISDAMAPGDRHRPITARNEFGAGIVDVSVTESSVGHSVLNSKAILSYDCGRFLGENTAMAERMSETEEKLAFIRRVRLARETVFETQKPILTILGIDQGTYKQYETRTPLPHRYIPKFCAATHVTVDWLLTGEGRGPAVTDSSKLVPQRGREAAKAKGRRAA